MPQPPKRRGAGSILTLLVIGLVAVAGGIYYVIASSDTTSEATDALELHTVEEGSFEISVPMSGELAAREQVEIVNVLEARATITSVVSEGTFVRKGDVLFELNDEEIRNAIRDQEDAVTGASNALDAALADMEIQKNTHRSLVASADLEIRLAVLDKEAWEKGQVVKSRKELNLEQEKAQKNYDRLVARFEASKNLLEQEFISLDEFKRDEIDMIESSARLEQATLAIEVYETYTLEQERETKESNLREARDERERTLQRNKAQEDQLQSDIDSRKRKLDLQREKLEKFKNQLDMCVVKSPGDGLVVYWASLNRDGRRNPDPPEVGTQLSRNEMVMVLPDTSSMVAEVKVNEALSGSIKAGQKAEIVSDALPDAVLTGTVLSVGVLAEGGSWRDPNRRDYTVRIQVDGENTWGLKPSMRCKANVFVDRVENAISVPVQSIFRNGPVTYVYVPASPGYAQKQVRIGRASELSVEILDGLDVGEEVLMRKPDPKEIVSEIEVPEFGAGGGPGGMPGGMKKGGGGGRPKDAGSGGGGK